MPGLPKPIENETNDPLWLAMIAWPGLLCVMPAMTFFGEPDASCLQWYHWTVRMGIVSFIWMGKWLLVAPRLGELVKRGRWVPPGAMRRPRLAAAYFSTLVVVFMTAIWVTLLY